MRFRFCRSRLTLCLSTNSFQQNLTKIAFVEYTARRDTGIEPFIPSYLSDSANVSPDYCVSKNFNDFYQY